ncbi:hypothetical protein BKA67DRAFT_645785 [Truncatella angustata]|uniref:Uncharacterized protein n=1 Tax=Truncatella angustata TaxID=152316 RepID=A0A9P8ZXD1_9PEZI|nr:uncharacterized protein BKA67DRAFT_645785 [Truncatella angustata]KAH6653988.1 hypothetical protein BKA67DRAFT_645785 [Truncatella angustata]
MPRTPTTPRACTMWKSWSTGAIIFLWNPAMLRGSLIPRHQTSKGWHLHLPRMDDTHGQWTVGEKAAASGWSHGWLLHRTAHITSPAHVTVQRTWGVSPPEGPLLVASAIFGSYTNQTKKAGHTNPKARGPEGEGNLLAICCCLLQALFSHPFCAFPDLTTFVYGLEALQKKLVGLAKMLRMGFPKLPGATQTSAITPTAAAAAAAAARGQATV